MGPNLPKPRVRSFHGLANAAEKGKFDATHLCDCGEFGSTQIQRAREAVPSAAPAIAFPCGHAYLTECLVNSLDDQERAAMLALAHQLAVTLPEGTRVSTRSCHGKGDDRGGLGASVPAVWLDDSEDIVEGVMPMTS